jgi:tetratricopeptide (TPR) repeat protein
MEEEVTEFDQFCLDFTLQMTGGQLSQALNALRTYALKIGYHDISQRVNERLLSYHCLLSNMQQGAEDPLRDELYNRLYESAYEESDLLIDRFNRLHYTDDGYYEMLRQVQKMEEAQQHQASVTETDSPSTHDSRLLTELQLQLMSLRDHQLTHGDNLEVERQMDQIVTDLFNRLWTDFPSTEGNISVTRQLLMMHHANDRQRCLLLTALTLNLFQWFDARKVRLLMDMISDDQPIEFLQRAWCGLVLVAMRHGKRIMHYADLVEGWDDLCLRYKHKNNPVLTLQLQILQTMKGLDVMHRLENEITDELEALNKQWQQDKAAEQQRKEGNRDTLPPVYDWNNYLLRSPLNQKLQELAQMRSEGVDILMTTFAKMSHVPYFAQPAAWLMPFDSNYSAVAQIVEKHPEIANIAKLFDHPSQLCNSDKYSFFFGFSHEMIHRGNALAELFSVQIQQSILGDEERHNPQRQAEMISRAYLHDLYRFFMIRHSSIGLNNPFLDESNLCELPLFSQWLNDAESLSTIAQFQQDKGDYDDAFTTYERLYKVHPTVDVIRSYAYCAYHKKEPNYPLTERLLLKANMMEPGNLRTLLFFARYYDHQQCYPEAVAILDEALMRYPDNTELLLDTARYLIKDQKFREALKVLYRAEILGDSHEADAVQLIVRCHLRCGDVEKAEAAVRKLMERWPTTVHCTVAAIVALRRGEFATAVKRCTTALQISNRYSTEEIYSFLENNRADLQASGIDWQMVNWMIDAVQMNVL